jgi:hypothetical protein
MNPYYKNRLFADRRTSFSQRSLGKSVYYYSSAFARLAQIFRGRKFSDLEIPPAKAQRRQVRRRKKIFLRILLTIFSDLSGPFDVAQDMLGVFAGDIPSFGCGGAALC